MSWWRRFWHWVRDPCPIHGTAREAYLGCWHCFRDGRRAFEAEERTRRVQEIADGVKLALREMKC